jgi:hypothetical protein
LVNLSPTFLHIGSSLEITFSGFLCFNATRDHV